MWDAVNILLISCIISIYVSTRDCHDMEENAPCQPLRYHGTCQQLHNCPVALEALNNTGNHELDGCGIRRKQKMVCCPDPSIRQPVFETATEENYFFSGNEGIITPDNSASKKCDIENSICQLLCHHGTCKTVKNCPAAVKAYGDTGTHELDRCGFAGFEEIVCCPGLLKTRKVINRGPKIKRKCQTMCQKVYTDNNINPIVMETHILNGKNATVGQFPHAVALGFENAFKKIEWNCGASLISPRFLLTAAHCFVCLGCTEPKKARMGIVDIRTFLQDIDVKIATSHPEYHPTSKHNDIAIVELVKDVDITSIVYPACLYTEFDDPKRLQVIGWGQTVNNDRNSKSNLLQFATVDAVPLEQCNATMAVENQFSLKLILQTQICATGRPSDACSGDSGGPLQTQKKNSHGYHIVGVVSYGVQCGGKVPAIYTRVATYLDWIEEMVWPDLNNTINNT